MGTGNGRQRTKLITFQGPTNIHDHPRHKVKAAKCCQLPNSANTGARSRRVGKCPLLGSTLRQSNPWILFGRHPCRQHLHPWIARGDRACCSTRCPGALGNAERWHPATNLLLNDQQSVSAQNAPCHCVVRRWVQWPNQTLETHIPHSRFHHPVAVAPSSPPRAVRPIATTTRLADPGPHPNTNFASHSVQLPWAAASDARAGVCLEQHGLSTKERIFPCWQRTHWLSAEHRPILSGHARTVWDLATLDSMTPSVPQWDRGQSTFPPATCTGWPWAPMAKSSRCPTALLPNRLPKGNGSLNTKLPGVPLPLQGKIPSSYKWTAQWAFARPWTQQCLVPQQHRHQEPAWKDTVWQKTWLSWLCLLQKVTHACTPRRVVLPWVHSLPQWGNTAKTAVEAAQHPHPSPVRPNGFCLASPHHAMQTRPSSSNSLATSMVVENSKELFPKISTTREATTSRAEAPSKCVSCPSVPMQAQWAHVSHQHWWRGWTGRLGKKRSH